MFLCRLIKRKHQNFPADERHVESAARWLACSSLLVLREVVQVRKAEVRLLKVGVPRRREIKRQLETSVLQAPRKKPCQSATAASLRFGSLSEWGTWPECSYPWFSAALLAARNG